MQLGRDIGIAADQERREPKQLQLLRAFFSAAQQPQIIKFAPRRSLLKAQRITEEREMRFAQKRWNHAGYQRNQQPRRINENPRRQADVVTVS